MKESTLRKLEGLQTIDMIAEKLNITEGSARNVITKLKKEQHLTKWGRKIYKITMRKQRPRQKGMFDIINEHSPWMKLNEWYDHQVYGEYGPAEALIDAINSKSHRAILASMQLFKHIDNWQKLYNHAGSNWHKVAALYDVARLHFRVRKMPRRYRKQRSYNWEQLTQLKNRNNFPDIQKRWKVYIPFNQKDIRGLYA